MQQLYVCPQGHRWHTDADAGPENPTESPRCPVCGQATESTAFQDLRAGASTLVSAATQTAPETTAFQDLGANPLNAGVPQFSLAPSTTAFQDLKTPKEDTKTSRPPGLTDSTDFQEIAVKHPDRTTSAIAPGGSSAPARERSTAVTVRFPGLRREALARPLPALPGYEVLDEIGRCATSVVYVARETALQRVVAIKLITAGEYGSAKQSSWLRAELEAVARLEHPCVAQVYEVGEHAGRTYVVMEYVDGGTLEQKVRGKPQSTSSSAQMAETLARALAYAHEHKRIHRNLKPSNILLTSEGLPKITDFAMARAAECSTTGNPDGMIGGNPSYMAPEHLNSEQTALTLQRTGGPATDIYALGCILFEMITGRPPFLGATPADTIELARHEDPISASQLRINVSPALEAICLRCLAKRPEGRYATAQELAEDLHRYLVAEPTLARPAGPGERAWKWARRRPFLLGSAALLVLCYAFLVGSLISYRSRLLVNLANAENRTAEAERGLESTRRSRYLADMNVAQAAWMHADRDSALKLLEKYRKDEDLRGFEWGHLWRMCHSDRLTLKAGRVHALAFSADGRALATVGESASEKEKSSGEIRLWDTHSGEASGKFAAPKAPALAAAFAPVGRMLATGDGQGNIQLWDAAAGQQRQAFPAHKGAVHALAFAPDSKTLASASADGTVKLWDTATGKLIATFPDHPGAVTSVAFSADGKLLASGCKGDPERNFGEVRVWEGATRTQRAVLQGHQGPVMGVAFAPDGKTLVSGGGVAGRMGELKLWDLATHRHKTDLSGCLDRVQALVYSADGKTLAVAGDEGTISLWNMERLPRLQSVLSGHRGPITALTIAADSDTLATASADETVKVWSLSQAGGARVLHDEKLPITLPVNSLAFATSGNTPVLASAGGESGRSGEIRVWDAARGQLLAALDRGLNRSVLAVALSPDGNLLAAASEDATTRIWKWSKGEMVSTLKGHTDWVTCVAFSARGNMVATGSADNSVRLWEVEAGRELSVFKDHSQRVLALTFSPDGALLASADANHDVHIWKVFSRQKQLKITGRGGPILALAFSPDGKTLATGGSDLVIRTWDVETGHEIGALYGHTYAVTSLAFAPDGRSLASCARDGSIRLWDIATGQPRLVLRGHADWVTAVAFSSDGKILASASLDRTVRLWRGSE